MDGEFSIRRMASTDAEWLNDLNKNSPDSGLFRAYAHYCINPEEAHSLQNPNNVGVVVETQLNELIGFGLVSVEQGLIAGEQRPYALLSSLLVHSNYRQRGIATQLARWRRDYAREELGVDAIILASIQKQNIGSFKTAQKWCQAFVGCIQGGFVQVRKRPPTPSSQFTVRKIRSDEIGEFTRKLNHFYRNHDLFCPLSEIELTAWLAETPFDIPFRHGYVVVDQQNKMYAGLVVVEQHRLTTMIIEQMPRSVTWLNKILQIVPANGVMNQLSAGKFWYDHQEAGSLLWETVRWDFREHGNGLLCFFDPRGPLPSVLNLPRWMPKSEFTFAINKLDVLSDDRLIYYGV